MADYLGSRPASSTVRFSFTTHAASGAPVAPSSAFENSDLRIYKDGSATQRSSASGITMTSPFDSVTGLHHVDIDLSDNADAGFYAAASFYEVHLVPDETVDSLAIAKVLAYFDIGVPVANVTQFGGTAGTFASGIPEVKVNNIAANALTATAIAADAITAAKIADGAIDAATFAAGAITAAAIAADAIGASELAADAVAEIQSGLATAAALAVVDGIVDDILVDTAEIGAAGAGLTNINLPNQTMDIVGSITGSLSGSVGSVTGAVGSVTGAVGSVTGAVGSIASGGIAAASFAANAITAAKLDPDVTTELQSGLATASALSTVAGYIDTEIAAIVTTLGTPAGASVSADILTLDNLVDDLESRIGTPSNLGGGATVAANLSDIEAQTDDIGALGAGLTAVPWNASWDAELEGEVLDALNTILADSVPADGTIPTLRQAVYMIWQFLAERSVSGTTLTIRKADGSTSLMTFTLSDATSPTSVTRTT